MTFEAVHCRSILAARAAWWHGTLLPVDQADVISINTTGLLPFLLEGALENVRRWGIRFVALPNADECIRLAGILINHPGQEAVDAINGMDNATYLTVRLFLPGCDSRN